MKSKASLRLPNELYFGNGYAEEVGIHAREIGGEVVFLVSDHDLKSIGLVKKVEKWLLDAGLRVYTCLDVEKEPSIQSIDPCLDMARKLDPDVVIGLGGGSVLDTIKTLAMLLINSGTAEDYIGTARVQERGVPTILLPTTAGTGAEVSPNALFYIPEEKSKKAIISHHTIPNIAIVDPMLTLSAPPDLTAATGLDALCHAIESYTAVNATPLTRPFAREAILLISRHLRKAVFSGDNIEAREGQALGSLYAAISLANSGSNAVHALAYPLQGVLRIQHGVANSLLLPYVVTFNMLGDIPRFAEIARFMGIPTSHLSPREAAEMGANACRQLSQDIGIPQSLREIGVGEEHIEDLVEGALGVKRLLLNNPRPISRNQIEAIYRQAL